MAIDPRTSRFWQETLRSGLLDEPTLRECWEAIPEGKREPEAIDRRLARQAVTANHLTLWQAQQILAGRAMALKIGKYVVLDVIGRGGMGLVFLARDTRLKRLVAVKVLSRERMSSPRALARFEREAKVGAQLQHDNLVRIYDEGEHRDLRYLVMEYIEGRNVAQILADVGRLPPALAASIARQVAMGLEHARLKGLIHRDVNPQNILVTYDGTAKLADLGLAIDLGDPDDVVTRDGATVGTFDYISPEQARHPRSVDTRSDLYSLGCTLYHMIAGRVPFQAASLPEKLYAHQLQMPEPLSQLVPGVPPGLEAIVFKMLAKAPDDRFSTPLGVAEALAPYAEQAQAVASILRPEPEANDASDGRRPQDSVIAPDVRSDTNGDRLGPEDESPGMTPTRTSSALRPGSSSGAGPGPGARPAASALADQAQSDSDPGMGGNGPGERDVPPTEPEPESEPIPRSPGASGLGLVIDLGPEPSLIETLGASRSRTRTSLSRSESVTRSTDRARKVGEATGVTLDGGRRRWLLIGLAVAVVMVGLLTLLFRGPSGGPTGPGGPVEPGSAGGEPAPVPEPGGGDLATNGAHPARSGPAFAVGPEDGSRLMECDSLEAALNFAPTNGGTVFIGDPGGPVRIGPGSPAMLVPGASIVLRPMPGTRCQLTIWLEGRDPWLRQRTGSMRIEDLTLLVRYGSQGAGARPPLIETDGNLTLQRCTFSVQSGDGQETRAVRAGASTRVEGCLFRGFDRPLDLLAYPGMVDEVVDSIFVWPRGQSGARPGWAIRVAVRASGQPRPPQLTIERCSVLRAAGLVETTSLMAEPRLAIRVAGSAVRADHLVCWTPPAGEDAFPSGLRWTGQGNRYDIQGASWVVSSPDGLASPPSAPTDLASWGSAIEGNGEDDSARSAIALADESAFESGSLDPARFAASSDGDPIGADPTEVGPPAPATSATAVE
ncbi:serine/threonine-protein kinase [Tautonia sociabilis]|uniref:Serine/threonine protein kinase n=1 Tax=Tautonia sociabilis TaxID=2080755 RepID=A0A432MIY4_9BACT|nr:serine/threonine-protein kinase [Tautonia sociabilis]RUL87323.1 serine/threonine protein kinase [Tautonia sociabilis]